MRLAFRGESLEPDTTRRALLHGIAALILVAVASTGLAALFLARERFIYSWDHATYWVRYGEELDLFRARDFLSLLKNLVWTVWFADYNDIPALGLLPFGLVFGPGRHAFVLGIIITYALPAAVLLFLVAAVFLKLERGSIPAYAWVFAFGILLFPPFWSPILYGRPDVGGWLFLCPILILLFTRAPAEWSSRECVAVGIGLSAMILFRRWYAYWAVAFYLACGLEILWGLLRHGQKRIDEAIRGIRSIAISAIISAAFFGAFAFPLLQKIATTNYSAIYAAYRGTSLLSQIHSLVGKLGAAQVAIGLLGAAFCLSSRTTRGRSVFLMTQTLIIPVLFLRTSNFGTQHLYLLEPSLLLLSFGIVRAVRDRASLYRRAACAAFLFLGLLSIWGAFVPSASWIQRARVLLPPRHWPLVRHDIDEIRRLCDVLFRETSTNASRIYVLASSQLLNSSTLAWKPGDPDFKRELAQRLAEVHGVDQLDGFPFNLMTTTYVVVGVPAQTHLRPCDQRVVTLPAEEFIEGRGIARSYERLPFEFRLDESIRVWIFRRIGRVNPAAILDLVRRTKGPCS